MAITILYFSWIKEKIGTGEEQLTPPSSVTTISDLIGWLKEQSPAHTDAFTDVKQIRAALDQTHVPFETKIGSAGEIAFFPPVTGG